MDDREASRRTPATVLATARRLSGRLPYGRLGGPVLLGGLGLGHVFVAFWNVADELARFGVEWGPLLAFALIAGPGVALCALAYRTHASELGDGDGLLVGASGVVGALFLGAIVYLSMVVRISEGRPVSEPVFVLAMTSGMGGLTGAIVGGLYARALRSASVAEQRRTQLEFMNSAFRHDVLNSMTVIRARAELLAEAVDGREREFAESILEHSRTVVGLTERIRGTIQAINRPGAVDRTPTPLAPVVERRVEPFRKSHDDVRFETDVGDVSVLADDLLEEVVGNLLDNAVEHGAAGTDECVVSVTTVRRDGRVQLRVADTGTGVSDELKDALFDRGTSEGGGGFGLFFVETMVEHYGGDVWVEDNDPTGAVFVVELDAA